MRCRGSWCSHTVPTVTAEELERARNAAAVRVRARRRIRASLLTCPGAADLAPLLVAAKKLEEYERMRQLR